MRFILEWWWVILPAGFFLLLFGVTLWEKQPLHEFEPAGPQGIANPSAYFAEMNRQAKSAEFVYCGEFRQCRGSSTYSCYLAVWLSPDGTTLIRINGGKVAGIPNRRTIISSWSKLDTAIESSDEFGTLDLGGSVDRQILLNADLNELLTFHAERRKSFPQDCRKFSPGQVLQEQEALDRIRVRKLISLGYARFIDPSESVWRYTIKGAFANYWRSYRQQKAQGMRQLGRSSKKRPGD